MVIVNENMIPVYVDNIDIPILVDYFWVLDLEARDFCLSQLFMNEEIVTPTLSLSVGGSKVVLPTSWHILVVSEDTYQLDIVTTTDLTKNNFCAAVYDHESHKIKAVPIRVMDYTPIDKVCSPTLHKNQMLCVGISRDHTVAVTPTDNFSKYLKGATISDILY